MSLALQSARTALVLLALAAPACAETIAAPKLVPGDTWTYVESNTVKGGTRTAHDVITLVRADANGIAVEVHPAGTPGPGTERLVGPNWSRIRSVNGQQVTVNRPLAFPMSPGKSWQVAYTEFTPADRRHTREGWDITMKVVGWETVDVPAGSFRALKIEGEGTWTADTAANVVVARGRAPNGAEVGMAQRNAARTISGRFYKVFWYVPEVHRWVKSEEDVFDTNGVRTSQSTADLESFSLADPHGEAAREEPAREAVKPHHAKAPRAAARPVPAPTAPPASPKRVVPAAPTSPLQETRIDQGARALSS